MPARLPARASFQLPPSHEGELRRGAGFLHSRHFNSRPRMRANEQWREWIEGIQISTPALA